MRVPSVIVRLITPPLAAACALLALTSCGSPAAEDAADAPAESNADAAAQLAANMAPVDTEPTLPAIDAQGFAGAKVAFIASGLSFTFSQEVLAGVEEATEAVGGTVSVTDSGGDPAKASSLIDQAVAQDADVVLLQGVDPGTVAAAMQGASEAGTPVVSVASLSSGAVPAELADQGLSALVAFSTPEVARHIAEYIAAESGGDGVVYYVGSSTFATAALFSESLATNLDRACPDCELLTGDSPVAQWQTGLQSQTQAFLTAHPDVDFVVPVVDAMDVYVDPAVQSTGRDIAIVTSNATLSSIEAIVAGFPNTWIGWAAVDQAIRLLAGEAPVDDEQIPVRTFTQSNAASLDLEDPSSWYASFDFRDFYRELWSVG